MRTITNANEDHNQAISDVELTNRGVITGQSPRSDSPRASGQPVVNGQKGSLFGQNGSKQQVKNTIVVLKNT